MQLDAGGTEERKLRYVQRVDDQLLSSDLSCAVLGGCGPDSRPIGG
jgi:hypothetical protein